jgi:uncharacterized protein (TIGR02118 family)
VYTVTVLYPQPLDPAAFDQYHDKVHVPIAAGMKGLLRWTVQRIEARDGVDTPFYALVQLSAPSKEALQTILDSPEGRAAADDLPNFATGGAIFLFGEQAELPTTATKAG